MAATWTITKQAIKGPPGNVRVTAVRTDGEDVQAYPVEGIVGETAASKTRIVNAIWDAYQAATAKAAADALLLDGLETTLATALSKKEPK